MAYPYIGNSTSKTTGPILFYSYKSGIRLEDIPGHKKGFYCETWNESLFANITHEYLRNTYGKVESKEHAEFIVKLANEHGIALDNKFDLSIYSCYFVFRKTEDDTIRLGFYSRCAAVNRGEKLITLPLPPKESEEWPKVGDEVLIDSGEHMSKLENFNGEKCKIIGICDHKGEKVLTLSHGSLGIAALIMGDWIKKPPTPEEDLAKSLFDATDLTLNPDCTKQMAKAIINGEIKGLSYKPD